MNFIKHHTEQKNDFSHTVTVKATKNIVSLCIGKWTMQISSNSEKAFTKITDVDEVKL